ncbi:Uncharacterised protein [Mycobacteroides abscessus subsp. abscessus]|nr:Uncharacterised protein [Mycobacteroides abscessus subsp. abscessus]
MRQSATAVTEACSRRISSRKSVRGLASAFSAMSGMKVPAIAGRSNP